MWILVETGAERSNIFREQGVKRDTGRMEERRSVKKKDVSGRERHHGICMQYGMRGRRNTKRHSRRGCHPDRILLPFARRGIYNKGVEGRDQTDRSVLCEEYCILWPGER